MEDTNWIELRKIQRAEAILSVVLGVICLLGGPFVVAVGVTANPMVPQAIFVGAFVIVAALGLLGYGIVRLAGARGRRLRVALREDDFLLEQGDDVRTVGFDEVVSAALESKRQVQLGGNDIITQTFTIWLANGDELPAAVKLPNQITVAGNPLGELIGKITGRIHERAKLRVEAGQPVLGPDWAWERNTLTVTPKKGEPIIVSLADLIASDIIDNQVTAWVRGQDDPIIRIPATEPDSYLLSQLLADRVNANPEVANEAGESAGEGFGRVIFERKSKVGGALIGVGVVVVLVGLFLFVVPNALPPAILVTLGGLALAFYGYRSRRDALRCHERGVVQVSFGNEKRLKYGDVDSFTFGSVRQFVNGAYTGTTFSLKLKPVAEQRRHAINYQAVVQGTDDELDGLRVHIAKVLAWKGLKQLRAGEIVPWTANLELRPDGLSYRPAGFLGRKGWQEVSYADITGTNMNQGTYFLWVKGQDKPVVSEVASADNFWPGCFLYGAIADDPAILREAEEA